MTAITARVVVTDRSEHRDSVYDAIDGERSYQEATYSDKPRLRLGEFILLLDEYVAKAKLSWSQEKRPEGHTLGIVRKIAGIAVNAMETHGVVEREGFEVFKNRRG